MEMKRASEFERGHIKAVVEFLGTMRKNSLPVAARQALYLSPQTSAKARVQRGVLKKPGERLTKNSLLMHVAEELQDRPRSLKAFEPVTGLEQVADWILAIASDMGSSAASPTCTIKRCEPEKGIVHVSSHPISLSPNGGLAALASQIR